MTLVVLPFASFSSTDPHHKFFVFTETKNPHPPISVGFESSPIDLDASRVFQNLSETSVFRWDFESDGIWDTGWLDELVVQHTWYDDYRGNVTIMRGEKKESNDVLVDDNATRWNAITRTFWLAQSFVPTMPIISGVAADISINWGNPPPLQVFVRDSLELNGTNLGSGSLPADNFTRERPVPFDRWPEIDLPDVELQVGRTYYLLFNISKSDPAIGTYEFHGTDDFYGEGTLFTGNLTMGWVNDTAHDLRFRTWIDTIQVLETEMLEVDIRNVPPGIEIESEHVSSAEGSSVNLSVRLTDPGSDDLFVTWEWGDGSTSSKKYLNDPIIGPDPYPSPDRNPRDVSDTSFHTYGDNGNFTITLTVVDDDNNMTVGEIAINVVNIAPSTESIEYYLNASFAFRIAGEKWHNVEIYLYEDGTEVGYASITRYPGSPNEQMADFGEASIDFSKTYSAVAYYTPEDDPINGQIWGATPAWVILEYEDGEEGIHHTFNVRHEDTWIWEIDDFSPYFLGHNITFTATASDPGSDDLTFSWDWGDGNMTEHVYYNDGVGPDPYPSPEVNPITVTDTVRHDYASAGTHVITLTVTDDDGGVTSYSLNLTL